MLIHKMLKCHVELTDMKENMTDRAQKIPEFVSFSSRTSDIKR